MKTKYAVLAVFFFLVLLNGEDLRAPRCPYLDRENNLEEMFHSDEFEFWKHNFLSRVEFHSTNRFMRFELTEYWTHVGDYDYNISFLLQGALERSLSDSLRDFAVDLPIAIWFEEKVEDVSFKFARFAKKTFSGREESDNFSSSFGDKTRIPFDFRGVSYSDGFKVGLRPFSTDPNLFLGYVFDEHFRIQIRSALLGFNSPKSEFAFQFLPNRSWSFGGGLLFEGESLWTVGFEDLKDHNSSFKYFFSLNGRLFGGNIYSSFSHSGSADDSEKVEEKVVIGFRKTF